MSEQTKGNVFKFNLADLLKDQYIEAYCPCGKKIDFDNLQFTPTEKGIKVVKERSK